MLVLSCWMQGWQSDWCLSGRQVARTLELEVFFLWRRILACVQWQRNLVDMLWDYLFITCRHPRLGLHCSNFFCCQIQICWQARPVFLLPWFTSFVFLKLYLMLLPIKQSRAFISSVWHNLNVMLSRPLKGIILSEGWTQHQSFCGHLLCLCCLLVILSMLFTRLPTGRRCNRWNLCILYIISIMIW